MAEIAEILEITPAEVHDTMSFYGFFPQAPIGDVRVWVCRSISCMLRGGEEMLDHACHKLDIEPGQTTTDGKLTVEFAECLGICDFAPAALADDGRVFGPLDEGKVDAMMEELNTEGRDRRGSKPACVAVPGLSRAGILDEPVDHPFIMGRSTCSRGHIGFGQYVCSQSVNPLTDFGTWILYDDDLATSEVVGLADCTSTTTPSLAPPVPERAVVVELTIPRG